MSDDPVPAKRSAPGRPVDARKTDVIMQAARDIFFKHGFAQTSIEAIAAAAGVSKVTIYNRFGTKEALFAAGVEQECDQMREGLTVSIDASGTITDQLTRFALNMTRFLARDDITRLEAHLAVEAQTNPAVGELFLNAGPRRLHKFLAQMLASASARGDLAIDDADEAADFFAGMVKGLADLDRRFRPHVRGGDAAARRRIENAVALFVRAYAPVD